MRVLLISSNRFKQPWPVMPSGLLCVAEACNNAGYQTRVLDLNFSKNCEKDICAAIANFKPDVIGISIRNIDNGSAYNTLFLLDGVKSEVIVPCKKAFRGPIIIGGPAVGISGPEMLKYLDLEYAVRGDGEACILEFLKRLKDEKPFLGTEGLIIRKNGEIIQDPSPLLVNDLNTLPIPRPQRYIDLAPYRKFNSPLQIQTKRGCGLKCSYCVYNKIEGQSYRLRSPQLIANEIERLVKDTGIKYVEFTDSVFNIPLDHAKNVLRAVIGKNLKLKIRTLGLNPGAVDEELVDLMKRCGFRDVDLGAEAACDEILKDLGKNYTKEDVVRSARLLQAKNIPVMWYLLAGAPKETSQTIEETITTVVNTASKWDLINFGIGIRVYNGSPLAEYVKARRGGRGQDDNFLFPVSIEPEKISLDMIKVMVKRASFQYLNIFMYDEDENTSPFMQKFGNLLLKCFAPSWPIWRFFIAIRILETALGIRAIKRMLYERKVRL
jgi:radical SAM superfamily enzyme YgiQ (UPF0313 family)